MYLLCCHGDYHPIGQLQMKDSEISEEIPASLEVGLLSMVRKLITLLPDQRVRQVIGHVLQHEALIAIAHNKSIVVRTAVVTVSVWEVALRALARDWDGLCS